MREVGSTGAHTLPLLDGLRGVAALMVLTTHVGFQTGEAVRGVHGSLIARLDFGVALFFVLSGFLLARPWLGHGLGAGPAPSTRRYFVRRAARILPAYWAALVVVLLTTARGTPAGAVVSNALLTQTYTDDLLRGYTQTWSLCTEVAFYLVLPLWAGLVARVAGRSPGWAAGLLGAALPVSWAWTAAAAAGAVPLASAMWLPGHLDWFAAGMALALLDQVRRRSPDSAVARTTAAIAAQPASAVVLAAAVIWLAATPLGGPTTLVPPTPFTAVSKELLYCLAAALLLGACAFADQRQGTLAAALAGRVGRFLGRVSYGVFLWHLLVLHAVFAVTGIQIFSGWFWAVLVLTTVGSLAAAAGSWHLLEAPILRLAHRGGSPLPRTPAPAASH